MKADIEKLLSKPPDLQNIRTNWHQAGETPRYQLYDLWSLNLYDYHGRVILNGVVHEIRPGMVCLMPSGTSRKFFFKTGVYHRAAHFIPAFGSAKESPPPLIFEITDHFDQVKRDYDLCHSLFITNPVRATAVFWKLLWDVFSHNQVSAPNSHSLHPEVEKAMIHIENNLHTPLSAEDVVLQNDLSHSHLLRLFRKYTGMSIIHYINKRKTDRATYLLENTNLPIKSVACEIGIPDLQQFNKLIRKFLGASPRTIRNNSKTNTPNS